MLLIMVGKMMIEMVFLKNITKSNNLLITFSDLLETIFRNFIGDNILKFYWRKYSEFFSENKSWKEFQEGDCGI